MERKTIKVSIGKGEKKIEVPAEKRVWSKEDVKNDGNGNLTLMYTEGGVTPEEMVKLLNYAEDLKVRAAKRGEFTDTGAKTKNRQKATMWIMQQVVKGDFSYQQQYAEMAGKGQKELNSYLDELFDSTEELQQAE